MKQQSNGMGNDINHGYLVSSVEEGIRLIKQGSTKAILGGRETLYFNMKRYGKESLRSLRDVYMYIDKF